MMLSLLLMFSDVTVRDGWTLLTLQRACMRIHVPTRVRAHTQQYRAILWGKAAVFPSKGQLCS